eukprot:2276040-Pyramimonas_sp.AAC.1
MTAFRVLGYWSMAHPLDGLDVVLLTLVAIGPDLSAQRSVVAPRTPTIPSRPLWRCWPLSPIARAGTPCRGPACA